MEGMLVMRGKGLLTRISFISISALRHRGEVAGETISEREKLYIWGGGDLLEI